MFFLHYGWRRWIYCSCLCIANLAGDCVFTVANRLREMLAGLGRRINNKVTETLYYWNLFRYAIACLNTSWSIMLFVKFLMGTMWGQLNTFKKKKPSRLIKLKLKLHRLYFAYVLYNSRTAVQSLARTLLAVNETDGSNAMSKSVLKINWQL